MSFGELAVPGFDSERRALYEQGTARRGPRDLLLRALEAFGPDASGGEPRVALDLGAGLGHETEELLRRGWRVTATDASGRMLDLIRRRAEAIGAADRLSLVHARFEATPMPPSSFHLVHAGFSLPFCPAKHFARVWDALMDSIRPGGRFVGQLFGPNDEFVRTSPAGALTAHGADEVRRLLHGFEILVHEEIDRPGETAAGVPKYWHVHHLIAARSAAR